MLPAILGGIFSVIGQGVKGFFGAKSKQADVVESALAILRNVNSSEAQREQAIATIIAAEAQSGYWLAAVWRPLLMLVFASLIVARWFGYMPPDMTIQELDNLYSLLELGIGGYIGGRTLEKIIKDINVNRIISKLLG
jgi:hypothetical protein